MLGQTISNGVSVCLSTKSSKAALRKMADYLNTVTNDFARWTIQFIAGDLFDCIVFPIALIIVVYIITKAILRYVLGFRAHAKITSHSEGQI